MRQVTLTPTPSDGRRLISLDVDDGVPADELDTMPTVERIPIGRRGQLRTMRRQLLWFDRAVRTAQRDADRAMRDETLTETQRWDVVRRQRALAWRVCQEVLPLLGRVPATLQAEPEFIECQRAAHVLRRTVEAVLRDNATHAIELMSASGPRNGDARR